MIACTEPRRVYSDLRSVAQPSRRPFASFLPLTPSPCPLVSLKFTSLVFPSRPTVHCPLSTIALSPLAATLTDLPASVANKRLTVELDPLDATYKKRGAPPSHSGTHPRPYPPVPLPHYAPSIKVSPHPCAIIGHAASPSAMKASQE